MDEILIHKAYEHDELAALLNAELADYIDGVIMCWESTTSLFIYARRNITIEQVTITIKDLIGNVEIELVAEE